jgi:hypothetical protein
VDLTIRHIIEQRLQNLHFQFTDAVYSAVIKNFSPGVGPDIQLSLLNIMNLIYQTYLSVCMYYFTTCAPPLTDMVFSVTSRALLVPTNNGSTITGLSDIPLPYLFLSAPSVHILTAILASLAIFSLLVAYQLYHKHNHDGLARKLAVIAGSPFTLAGAMSMSSGQPWANEVTTPNVETIGSLSDSQARQVDSDKTVFATAPIQQEMMERLAQYTYSLDWSGKVVREP